MENEHGDLAARIREHVTQHIPEVSHGMTILVANAQKKLFFESFGRIEALNFTYRNETIYDLASLTKPLVTSTLVFSLIDRGKLSFEDTTATLGLFRGNYLLEKLTVRSLLSHTSGLPPTIPLYRRGNTRAAYLEGINDAASSSSLYKVENYSDLNYILLGFIIEEICGKTLNEVWNDNIAKRYRLSQMSYLPTAQRDMIAPTESGGVRGQIWGEVHDENSFFLGGVAGHAGLFSDAEGIYSFLTHYLKSDIISGSSLRKATRPANEYIGGSFGYGWMINTPRPTTPSPAFDFARFIGDIAPFDAYGHTGFTGTSIVVEPETGIKVVILANRVYPSRDNERILRFRRTLHNLIFSTLLD
jgi:CubicO group peptidase (beta-lactamase class C family)